MKKKGAVVVFRDGLDEKKIERALAALVEKGLLEHAPAVHEFDPEWGGPVWYVP